MMKAVAHLCLLIALASVGFAADKTRRSQVDDIREAVFRYQFDHNASGLQKNAKAYFIDVGENATDPADDFLKRFTDHNPPVRKISASGFLRGKGIFDKETGERGFWLKVTSIKWISDSEVKVDGGYYEGPLSSSSNTYTLKKEDGKWKVTKNKLNWIS